MPSREDWKDSEKEMNGCKTKTEVLKEQDVTPRVTVSLITFVKVLIKDQIY
jgi:hypothetical protein